MIHEKRKGRMEGRQRKGKNVGGSQKTTEGKLDGEQAKE